MCVSVRCERPLRASLLVSLFLTYLTLSFHFSLYLYSSVLGCNPSFSCIYLPLTPTFAPLSLQPLGPRTLLRLHSHTLSVQADRWYPRQPHTCFRACNRATLALSTPLYERETSQTTDQLLMVTERPLYRWPRHQQQPDFLSIN